VLLGAMMLSLCTGNADLLLLLHCCCDAEAPETNNSSLQDAVCNVSGRFCSSQVFPTEY
jgi:hypothetical protein